MLIVKENNSATISCAIKAPSSNLPQNITGWLFKFRVSTKDGQTVFDKISSDVTQIFITDAANGKVDVFIAPIDTSGRNGHFVYEFKATDTLGNQYTLDGPADFNITSTII